MRSSWGGTPLANSSTAVRRFCMSSAESMLHFEGTSSIRDSPNCSFAALRVLVIPSVYTLQSSSSVVSLRSQTSARIPPRNKGSLSLSDHGLIICSHVVLRVIRNSGWFRSRRLSDNLRLIGLRGSLSSGGRYDCSHRFGRRQFVPAGSALVRGIQYDDSQ